VKLEVKNELGNWNCKICKRSFGAEGAFRWHQKNSHKNYGIFTCKICNRVYKQREGLAQHLINAHQGPML